jgi:hypothetical protein
MPPSLPRANKTRFGARDRGLRHSTAMATFHKNTTSPSIYQTNFRKLSERWPNDIALPFRFVPEPYKT